MEASTGEKLGMNINHPSLNNSDPVEEGEKCKNKTMYLQFISKVLMITKDETNWYPNIIYLSVQDSNRKRVR